MRRFIKTSSTYSYHSGLTLVELIVVITIVLMMTAIILSNISSFRPRVELAGVAQEVATTIRQGQAYGAALRSATIDQAAITGGPSNLPKHILAFSTNPGDTFYFVADRDNNNSFELDCGIDTTSPECIERYNFRGGIEVVDIKLCNESDCSDDPNICIMFQVAEMNPLFGLWQASSGAGNCTIDSSIQRAEILLRNSRGDSAEIEVWLTGFISILLNDNT